MKNKTFITFNLLVQVIFVICALVNCILGKFEMGMLDLIYAGILSLQLGNTLKG